MNPGCVILPVVHPSLAGNSHQTMCYESTHLSKYSQTYTERHVDDIVTVKEEIINEGDEEIEEKSFSPFSNNNEDNSLTDSFQEAAHRTGSYHNSHEVQEC